MASWVADNPPFPGRAFREWITWMYKENGLVRGTLRLRGRRVDLRRIDQNLLVVTAGADHIAPRTGTLPLLDLVVARTYASRPAGRSHRADGRLEGAQRDLAGDRRVAGGALGPVNTKEEFAMSATPREAGPCARGRGRLPGASRWSRAARAGIGAAITRSASPSRARVVAAGFSSQRRGARRASPTS